jgi:hypothetical protein
MADLYNLDAEIEQGIVNSVVERNQEEEDNNEISADHNIVVDTNANLNLIFHPDEGETWDDGGDGGNSSLSASDVPITLREAAAARKNRAFISDKNDDTYDSSVLKPSQFNDHWNSDQLMSKSMQQLQLQDLPYTRLYHSWVQECHAPELLPFQYDVIQQIRDGLSRYEEFMEEAMTMNDGNTTLTNNENLNALVHSLLRIDVDRVKFLVSDLLRRRIQKLTLHPQHYVRLLHDSTENNAPVHVPSKRNLWMSEAEVSR